MGHTPGPWQAHGWGDAEVEIVGPNDRVICELAQEYDDHSGAGTNAAIEDDARLIAAAPDLLAACEAVANDCERILDGDDFSGMSDADLFRAFLDTLRPVIAKAEGADASS